MMKVTAVTGGRADWGLLTPVLAEVAADPFFALRLAVTGQHLGPGAGGSLEAIRQDGFAPDARIDIGLSEDDGAVAVTRALAAAVAGFAEEFAAHRPDLVLVLGDRYEIFGAAQAALMARVPVAHLCGGDVTEGAIDDSIRHAITKMAQLHFVTNEAARARVIRMGEDPARVFCVGNPGLDRVRATPIMERDAFFESVGLAARARHVIAVFHPVTREDDSVRQCAALLAALDRLGPDTGLILTGSNADAQGATLTRMARDFAEGRGNARFHESLGSARYINALAHCDVLAGNSSSGLYEAPSLGIATVNVGNRQKGRLKAASVIDCAATEEAIEAALRTAFSRGRGDGSNPYGDGHSAGRIVAVLKEAGRDGLGAGKAFYDVSPGD